MGTLRPCNTCHELFFESDRTCPHCQTRWKPGRLSGVALLLLAGCAKQPTAIETVDEPTPVETVEEAPPAETEEEPEAIALHPSEHTGEMAKDTDGDGVIDTLDCAPEDPSIHPGAVDYEDDGVDSNCDGMDNAPKMPPMTPQPMYGVPFE